MNVKIVRLSRVFGPTMLDTDTKASSQFIFKALAGEDIILKSKGEQFFSYTYVADAVAAMLVVLLKGEPCVAYNVSNERCNIHLKDFARTCARIAGKDVVFDIVNREKQYPLVVKVLGKETVKTDAGKFNCWVVEPQFRGEGLFIAKGKSLKVWLTDDEYRMPVKMEAEVFIGSVYAELLAYQRN